MGIFMVKNCKYCNNEFKTYPSVDRHYCSSKCYHMDRVQDRSYTKICEYCGAEFKTLRKKQVLCSKECLYTRRKERNWTTSSCLHCDTEFKHRKKVNRMFCSEDCQRRSEYKKNKLSEFMTANNPMKNTNSIQKISDTKLDRYGDASYNNMDKTRKTKLDKYGDEYYNNHAKTIKTFIENYGVDYPLKLDSIKLKREQTNLKRYGVANVFQLDMIKDKIKHTLEKNYGVSNATALQKRKSKPQLKLFEQIKKQYPDALLEHYLLDVGYSVDIFIPSEKKVVELYGDYWHCNPEKYESAYYHPQLHMKASEKWASDEKRKKNIENGGYIVEIVWESQV